jgi:hypothetical protein
MCESTKGIEALKGIMEEAFCISNETENNQPAAPFLIIFPKIAC